MLGRPRILCETRQREICALVSAGCTLETAAGYVDCSPITVRREARRNPDFQEGLRAARATAELSPIRTMCRAAGSDWRAAAWLLERTQPERYARRAPNTFTQQEVVELLGRVCDIVRRETRDQEQFTRIQRRVNVLARNTICSDSIRDQVPLPLPIPSPQPDSTLPPQLAASPTSPSTEQNGTKKELVMIRVSDVPAKNSKGFANSTRSE